VATFVEVQGDILQSELQVIINPVNCVGAMGRGLAKQVKDKYPGVYREYVNVCKYIGLKPGEAHCRPLTETQWVFNVPTKRHWRDKSKIDDVEKGLIGIVDNMRKLGFTTVAVPALGCGEGGLEYEEVKPLILKHLNQPNWTVHLYLPLED
jgi:O-acetyl-ADP-ribose deacetylase (regulator of RNase III)